jgi:hypothetical protein
MALSGPTEMSAIWTLSGAKRTSASHSMALKKPFAEAKHQRAATRRSTHRSAWFLSGANTARTLRSATKYIVYVAERV